MAQVTVLSSDTTAAVSSNIVIPVGVTRTVGLFSSVHIPSDIQLNIVIDTPGQDVTVGKLSAAYPAVLLNGPGTFRVIRPATSVAVDAFIEDA